MLQIFYNAYSEDPDKSDSLKKVFRFAHTRELQCSCLLLLCVCICVHTGFDHLGEPGLFQ